MFHFIDKYRASPTKTKNKKNNKSSNTLFGFLYARISQNFYLSVINIFLCLVMIFTFICWQLGVVESRNEKLHDTNSEFVITTLANHFQVPIDTLFVFIQMIELLGFIIISLGKNS